MKTFSKSLWQVFSGKFWIGLGLVPWYCGTSQSCDMQLTALPSCGACSPWGRMEEELCACLLVSTTALFVTSLKVPPPLNHSLFSCENQKTILYCALQDRKWLLRLVWYAPSPPDSLRLGWHRQKLQLQSSQFMLILNTGVPLKKDLASRIGFLTGVHFALGNDSLTCHSPYFHIYLDFSYLWHFRQPLIWISAAVTSWMECYIYPSCD